MGKTEKLFHALKSVERLDQLRSAKRVVIEPSLLRVSMLLRG